jgi:hypothetical protein
MKRRRSSTPADPEEQRCEGEKGPRSSAASTEEGLPGTEKEEPSATEASGANAHQSPPRKKRRKAIPKRMQHMTGNVSYFVLAAPRCQCTIFIVLYVRCRYGVTAGWPPSNRRPLARSRARSSRMERTLRRDPHRLPTGRRRLYNFRPS